ncbi:MAE_28990/MAE_18760 family HEPN-like nuclease, partial [Glaesserella parasuis]
YINSQKHQCSELKDNFHQIMLGKHLSDQRISSLDGENIHHQKVLFSFFKEQMQAIFKINEEKTISTKSNLNYDTLSLILLQLGLEDENFETKKVFIDEKLLDGRNSIAHGNKQGKTTPKDLYTEIKTELLDMIENFHHLIKESISDQTYLKTTRE